MLGAVADRGAQRQSAMGCKCTAAATAAADATVAKNESDEGIYMCSVDKDAVQLKGPSASASVSGVKKSKTGS